MYKYDLQARYDKRQSFYNKTQIIDNGNIKELQSYNTIVAECIGGVVKLLGNFSQTTTRHQKEFAKQFDTTGRTFEEIKKDSLKGDYLK